MRGGRRTRVNKVVEVTAEEVDGEAETVDQEETQERREPEETIEK